METRLRTSVSEYNAERPDIGCVLLIDGLRKILLMQTDNLSFFKQTFLHCTCHAEYAKAWKEQPKEGKQQKIYLINLMTNI